MRTFVALELPERARAALAAAQAPFRGLRGVRLLASEDCHLTLKFLGEIDEPLARRLAAELGRARRGRFALTLDRLGAFPDARRPRVVWAGVADEPALVELARAVDLATPEVALDKPFRAHVTLARVGPDAAPIPPRELERRLEPCTFEAERFALFRSLRGAGALRYEPLFRFDL